MFCLTKKITQTRLALDKWQKENFRARQQQMMDVHFKLKVIMEIPITTAVQVEKKELMSLLQSLLSQEKAFWTQHSNVAWLKEGDVNTIFFHRKASIRRRKNAIHGLFDN